MPNWCSNSLRVLGDEDAMRKMLEEIPTFSLDAVIPMPEELTSIVTGSNVIDGVKVGHWRWAEGGTTIDGIRGDARAIAIAPEELEALRKKYGALDWYGWAVSHWGTKWDIEPVEWLLSINPAGDHILEVTFDTAWAPPRPVVVVLSERYPALRFELSYSEGGCDFAGVEVFVAGEELEDQGLDITPSEHSRWDDEKDDLVIDDEFQSFMSARNLWIGG